MKTAIITGGLGFIGSNLIRALTRNNYFIINIDKISYASNIKNISSDIKNLKPQLSHQTELTNLENIIKSQFDALKNDLMGEKFTQEIANRVAKLIIITPPPPGKKTIEELIKNPIKLNTASKRDLLTVPGIGPQKALAILNRIEKKGNFQNINELAEIRGISKLNECFDIE